MKEEEILYTFPLHIRTIIKQADINWDDLQEIRLRIQKPVILKYNAKTCYLSEQGKITTRKEQLHIVTSQEIRQAMEYISSYSMYAYIEQLKQGFLTIRGGHRVGICGTVVMDHDKVKTIRHISGLNIRVAHEVKGCADILYSRCTRMGKLIPTLIISPPGCGKTTLLRLITGSVKPTEGKIFYNERNIFEDYTQYKAVLGYLPQHFELDHVFTVKEYLNYISAYKGLSKKQTKRRTAEALGALRLWEVRDKKIVRLSRGMRQRVGMAQAVLNKPKVLVLDEPSAYLDEREENLFYELAGEFLQDRIVIITERSSLDETRSRCEEVADWNLTMKNGKVGSI